MLTMLTMIIFVLTLFFQDRGRMSRLSFVRTKGSTHRPLHELEFRVRHVERGRYDRHAG